MFLDTSSVKRLLVTKQIGISVAVEIGSETEASRYERAVIVRPVAP